MKRRLLFCSCHSFTASSWTKLSKNVCVCPSIIKVLYIGLKTVFLYMCTVLIYSAFLISIPLSIISVCACAIVIQQWEVHSLENRAELLLYFSCTNTSWSGDKIRSVCKSGKKAQQTWIKSESWAQDTHEKSFHRGFALNIWKEKLWSKKVLQMIELQNFSKASPVTSASTCMK